MDLQTFLQWLFIVGTGASIFGAFISYAARKNGKEIRNVIKENHKETLQLLEKMDATQRQNHKETIQLLEKIDATQRQNHQETMEVLNKIVELLQKSG